MLRHPDNWVWDSWYAHDGVRHHAFYLQAPRSLGDPDLRHRAPSVGHATSTDLRSWQIHGDALEAGAAGSWDDRGIWTGSVLATDDGWAMLYTGLRDADDGRVQRVGLATSPDLHSWTRVGDGPVMEADPAHYETLVTGRWPMEAWRDPWLSRDADGTYHALLTARVADRPVGTAGVIGHARSLDLLDWEVLPPLCEASPFSRMEVVQVAEVGDAHVLCFCAEPLDGAEDAASAPPGGVWLAPAAGPLGPFDLAAARRVERDDLYAARLVADGDGRWSLLGFTAKRDGGFVGELADPIPLDEVWPA